MVNTLFLPEIREMLASANRAELHEFCSAIHPAATAEFMEGLTSPEAWQVLQYADPQARTEIFLYFDHDRQLELLKSQDRNQVADLISNMAPDERVDLLRNLDDGLVQELLGLISKEDRRDIMRLSEHPERTAGAMMTTAVVKFPESLTVQQALSELASSDDVETIYYLYIVDELEHLRGLVSTRELISHLGKPQTRLGDIMETELISVDVDDDQEVVAQKVARFDLLAIPVVDKQHRMLGIVTYDDVIDVVLEEAVEDAHRIGGVDPLEESYLRTGLITLVRKRAIWLAVLFQFSMITTYALKSYQSELVAWPWLVFFIPLIISSGGNSGSQSATLIITALVRKDVTVGDWWVIMQRELISGLLLGLFLSTMAAGAAFFMVGGELNVAGLFVLPLTVTLVVTCGTLCGSLLPLAFQRLGLDPALMSTPFVAGLVDIVGIIVFFKVAGLLLPGS